MQTVPSESKSFRIADPKVEKPVCMKPDLVHFPNIEISLKTKENYIQLELLSMFTRFD